MKKISKFSDETERGREGRTAVSDKVHTARIFKKYLPLIAKLPSEGFIPCYGEISILPG